MANVTTPSLTNLPDEVLADITLCMATSSVKDGASLGKVNKAFRRQWKTEGVQRVCHLGSLEFEPAIGDSAEIRSLAVAMTQFCQDRNPDALYREGITSYFDNRRTERSYEGLAQLEIAPKKCHIKARYLYGLVPVCSDLKRRDQGYDILVRLTKPRLLESMRRMARLSDDLTYKYLLKLQGGASKTIDIVAEYHGDWSHCHCEDKLEMWEFMDQMYGWGCEAHEDDPLDDLMCLRCFWAREINLLLHWL